MSVNVWRNPLSRHVVVDSQLVEVAMFIEEVVCCLFFGLFLSGFFLDWGILCNFLVTIQLESFQDLCNSRLQKREEIWHCPKILVCVHIIGAVLELIPEVLHSPIE